MRRIQRHVLVRAPGAPDRHPPRYQHGLTKAPNPFPKSIYDNVAIATKANGTKENLDDLVEESLTRAALGQEVKDELKDSAFSLSGGQQQRL